MRGPGSFPMESGTACASTSSNDSVEYFIAATLYDLADTDTDPGSFHETHDLVSNMDAVILSILDKELGARGSVPTIWDFRNAWYSRGLDGNDLDRILVKHGMLQPFQKARFVAQSVSSTLIAGHTATVSVTMKNIGSTTWSSTGAYRLGAQNPQDNTTWGSHRMFLEVPTVPPGAQATFHLNVTAPAAPGQYSFQWQMVQEAVQWFGDLTPDTVISVTAASQQAQAVAQSVPSPVSAGQTFTATMTMKNTGDTTWAPGSYVLVSQNNPSDLWTATQASLTAPVPPQATATFTVSATAPAEGGTYAFQWRMQQNGVGPFGDTTLTWVQVKDPPCSVSFCASSCQEGGCAGGRCTSGKCVCIKCF